MSINNKFLSVAPLLTLLIVPTGIQKEEIEDLGSYASTQVSELPAEPIEESYPYLNSIELENAVLEVFADEKSCPQWIGKALTAGWEPADLPRLLRIMWRESRCLPDACGETDSPHIRKCRDWGLMQINDYSWKRIIREMGMSIEQMHDPYWNLWFARWLFEYSLERNGDGWVPWKFPPK